MSTENEPDSTEALLGQMIRIFVKANSRNMLFQHYVTDSLMNLTTMMEGQDIGLPDADKPLSGGLKSPELHRMKEKIQDMEKSLDELKRENKRLKLMQCDDELLGQALAGISTDLINDASAIQGKYLKRLEKCPPVDRFKSFSEFSSEFSKSMSYEFSRIKIRNISSLQTVRLYQFHGSNFLLMTPAELVYKVLTSTESEYAEIRSQVQQLWEYHHMSDKETASESLARQERNRCERFLHKIFLRNPKVLPLSDVQPLLSNDNLRLERFTGGKICDDIQTFVTENRLPARGVSYFDLPILYINSSKLPVKVGLHPVFYAISYYMGAFQQQQTQ